MMEIKPAKQCHMELLGSSLKHKTVKAVIITDGDDVVAIGGSYRSCGNNVLFAHFTDTAKKHPRIIVKAARAFIKNAQKPLFAACDFNIKGADRFLEFLGFERKEGDLWQLRQQ